MKHDFTCIIVDDEPSSSEMLVDCLSYLYPASTVLGIYDTWKAALLVLRDSEYDLLFLDISMPGKTGLELLEILPDRNSEVIFITAHSDFALSAFKFAPSGYVVKPIDDDKLQEAINNAIERITYKRLAKQQFTGNTAKIGIPDKKGTEYVNLKDIIYIEAMNGCTRVVTDTGEITSSYTIGKFKSAIEKNGFIQIHRSFIVNVNCIKRYTSEGFVVLNNGIEISLSKNYKDSFLQIFSKISKTNL